MALTDTDQRHFSALTKLAFTPVAGDRPPEWLQTQFERCVSHYRNVPITPKFRAALNQFQNQQEQPFEVFAIGEGKFGKSTMVNALLGQNISAVRRGIPETRSFLRFVLASKPDANAIIYAQLRPGVHDEIGQKLGEGEVCEEIYATRRYRLSRELADALLAMDAAACREQRGRYTPAILEIERQLLWTPDSLFPEGVRLVDTQGLNQIFDDDLLKRCADMDLYSSEREFDNWMGNSRRGRHLDWQFRRCHAVLCFISAQRPNSGATRAALRYLNKYGKKTIIAVTQVDLVQGGPTQVDRVLNEIHSHFGKFGAEMIPINGRLAMDSSLARDLQGIESSGLANLAKRLHTVCTVEAGRERAVAQYVSLKETEAQVRTAIDTMIVKIEDIGSRLLKLRQKVESARHNEVSRIRNTVGGTGYHELAALKSRVETIGLLDDTSSAMAILQPSVANMNFQNSARSICILLKDRIKELNEELKGTTFSLPSFDAEGRENGAVISAKFELRVGEIDIPSLSLSIDLTVRPLKALKIWGMKKFSSMREQAEDEERQLNRDRRRTIVAELERGWNELETRTIDRIVQQAEKVFADLVKDLDRIQSEIEKVDSRPLSNTVNRLRQTLSTTCVESAYVATLVTAMRAAIKRSSKALAKQT